MHLVLFMMTWKLNVVTCLKNKLNFKQLLFLFFQGTNRQAKTDVSRNGVVSGQPRPETSNSLPVTEWGAGVP